MVVFHSYVSLPEDKCIGSEQFCKFLGTSKSTGNEDRVGFHHSPSSVLVQPHLAFMVRSARRFLPSDLKWFIFAFNSSANADVSENWGLYLKK